MQLVAKERNGKCLSVRYLGLKEPLKWSCEKGHEWEASARSVKYFRNWCPKCFNEKRIKNLKEYGQFKHPTVLDENGEKLRVCLTCEIAKPHEEMVKAKGRTDGIRSTCKECRKNETRIRREQNAFKDGRVKLPYKEKPFSNLSDDELLAHLRRFQSEFGRPPSSTDLENNPDFPHAYTYYRRFKYWNKINPAKGWMDILKLAGLEPLDYEKVWTAWEYLVTLACERIYTDCLYQSANIIPNYRPDIIVEKEKLIIDAATSNYQHKHKKIQYQKATKAGYRVEYWCLYRTTENGINEENLKYVFVDEIIEKLVTIKQHELATHMQNLLEQHDHYTEQIFEYKRQYIKARLVEIYNNLSKTPKMSQLKNIKGAPSAAQITRIFTSYNKALEYAGIPIHRKAILKYDEQIAVSELLELTERLGKVPTIRELNNENLTYSNKVYYKYFGGIAKCLSQNGVDVEKLLEKAKQEVKITGFEKIKSYYYKHQKMPMQKDFGSKNSLPSYHWVYENYGSLEELMKEITKEQRHI